MSSDPSLKPEEMSHLLKECSEPLQVVAERLQHYMTVLISPDGIVKILGSPPLSMESALHEHEEWVKMFKLLGAGITIHIGSNVKWNDLLVQEAARVKDRFEKITILYEATDGSEPDKKDEFSRWKIITGRFITTDIRNLKHSLTAYLSLDEEGAKQSSLSIQLRAQCIGRENVMSYYADRDYILFV